MRILRKYGIYLFLFCMVLAIVLIRRNTGHAPSEVPLVEKHIRQVSGSDSELAVSRRQVPEKATRVLRYIRQYHRSPPGYVGGREFKNREGRLKSMTPYGRRISYREWDVNPKRQGRNRGPERLVTGDDTSAWFSPDHYKTFIEINE